MVVCLACDKAIDYSDVKRKTKKFCDAVCRQMYFRRQRRLLKEILPKKKKEVKIVKEAKGAVPRVLKEPVRKEGEGMIDFLIRMGEWKKDNGVK